MTNKLTTFYDRQYSEERYATAQKPEEHSIHNELKNFIDTYQLKGKRCLEIGCGRGAFQDLVSDYTGVDISAFVKKYIYKPFCQCSATDLPFRDCSFDAIWTYAVLEHVPEPEKSLREIRRVLRHDGLLFLSPAWQCRPWAAEGYPVRPYRDFRLKGKLIKASIPIRNSVWFRSLYVFPRRLLRSIDAFLTGKRLNFKYKKLAPNYDYFWMSDSDAVNSMDPYEAVLWFVSRGDTCISYPTWIAKLLVRTGPIIFRIQKD